MRPRTLFGKVWFGAWVLGATLAQAQDEQLVDKINQVAWQRVNNDLPPALTPQVGEQSIAIYDPNTIGTGKIRIDVTGGALIGEYFETATLTVEQEPAVAWR